MRNHILRCNVFLILILLASSCTRELYIDKAPLDRLNWEKGNYKVLNEFILKYGRGGDEFDSKRPPYVVLDWDQTCAHFDVEEALLCYQMLNLRFRMEPRMFASILKDTINGATTLNEDYQNKRLADLNDDLEDDYTFLYDNYIGSSRMSLEQVREDDRYMDFIAKLAFIYHGYCDTESIGDDYGYPWVLELFAGHTMGEVQSMAREAIEYELGNKIGRLRLSSPEGLPGRAGVVSYSFKTGLRVYPEMQNLISTFQRYGFKVFIVSASFRPVVEIFSGIGNFGYTVPSENVIAMEMELDNSGRVLTTYKKGWFKTFGAGKVEAIDSVVKRARGMDYDPVFSAVDSDGDYQMCTLYPGMKLTLIWDRKKGGKIGELYKMAAEQEGSPAPRYILQGRNENTGLVIPEKESIILK